MPTIAVSKARVSFKLGKRKKRSQMCHFITTDGRLIDVEMDVLYGCMQDPQTGDAHLVDPVNQFYDEDNKYWVQLISEGYIAPIQLIKKDTLDIDVVLRKIYHDSREDAMLRRHQLALKADWWNKILWAITIPSITFGFIALLQYLEHRGH